VETRKRSASRSPTSKTSLAWRRHESIRARPKIEAVGRGLLTVTDALHVVEMVEPDGWASVVEMVELGEWRTARAAIRYALG
jgi:hypothetical protein